MSEILKTTDYSIFSKHLSNREIDQCNLKKIIASIKARNLLQFRPILVDSEMKVIDGQHRLEAAKILGVEVYYQIQPECTHEDIVLLNQNQKSWVLDDYIDYYCSRGSSAYLQLRNLCTQYKYESATILRIISGNDNGAVRQKIRSGSFVYFDQNALYRLQIAYKNGQEILDLLKLLILKDKKFLSSATFNCALLRFLYLRDIDFQIFKQKVRLKSDSIKPCSNFSSYSEMFKDIYNWKNQNPID